MYRICRFARFVFVRFAFAGFRRIRSSDEAEKDKGAAKLLKLPSTSSLLNSETVAELHNHSSMARREARWLKYNMYLQLATVKSMMLMWNVILLLLPLDEVTDTDTDSSHAGPK
eukprot:scaffold1257_cov140-Skeletonema_menzelii.AAC.8